MASMAFTLMALGFSVAWAILSATATVLTIFLVAMVGIFWSQKVRSTIRTRGWKMTAEHLLVAVVSAQLFYARTLYNEAFMKSVVSSLLKVSECRPTAASFKSLLIPDDLSPLLDLYLSAPSAFHNKNVGPRTLAFENVKGNLKVLFGIILDTDRNYNQIVQHADLDENRRFLTERRLQLAVSTDPLVLMRFRNTQRCFVVVATLDVPTPDPRIPKLSYVTSTGIRGKTFIVGTASGDGVCDGDLMFDV